MQSLIDPMVLLNGMYSYSDVVKADVLQEAFGQIKEIT